jgi:anti-sigma B factor antagonist
VIDYHRYTTGPDRDILVVQVSGRLDNDSSPFFFDCLEGEIEDGNTQVVLDCSELAFLSSLGIGTLIRIQSRLRQRGGTVKLAAVQGVVADVLHVVHLDRLLDIYPDVAAAVAAFETSGGRRFER